MEAPLLLSVIFTETSCSDVIEISIVKCPMPVHDCPGKIPKKAKRMALAGEHIPFHIDAAAGANTPKIVF